MLFRQSLLAAAGALTIGPIRALFSFQALHGRDFALLGGAWAASIMGLLVLRLLVALPSRRRRLSL